MSYDGLLRPGVEFDPVAAWANIKSGIVDRLMTDRDRAELENPRPATFPPQA